MRLLSPADAALFALERELAEIRDGFPDSVTSSLARTMRDVDRSILRSHIERIRREDGEATVAGLRVILMADAPILHGLHGDLLEPRSRWPSLPVSKPVSKLWFLLVPGMVSMVIAATRQPGAPRPAAAPTSYHAPAPYVPSSGDDGPLRGTIPSALAVAEAAAALSEAGVASEARALARLLGHAGCDDGALAFTKLSRAIAALPSDKRLALRREVDELRAAIATTCVIPEKDLP